MSRGFKSDIMERIGIGVIGCGTIAEVYLNNIQNHYHNLRLIAVADLFPEKAAQAAARFGARKACTIDEMLADDDIRIIVNLTIPTAHYDLNKKALEAGKHVYCEKPLAMTYEEAGELVALAKEKHLMCVSAPDTFLGAGIQGCRKLIEDGTFGEAVSFMVSLSSPGHELWHPNPGFLYQKGGGPLFDMGPYYLTALVYLFGSIRRIFCFTTTGRPDRNILGKMTRTEVPTTYTGVVEMACGAVGNICMSLDTWDTTLPLLELYGTRGTIYAPDPNFFNGRIRFCNGDRIKASVEAVTGSYIDRLETMLRSQKSMTEEVPFVFPAAKDERENMRGLGVSDMAQALLDNRNSRLSAELSLHVTEALCAFDKSAETGLPYVMETGYRPTEAMGSDWSLWEVR